MTPFVPFVSRLKRKGRRMVPEVNEDMQRGLPEVLSVLQGGVMAPMSAGAQEKTLSEWVPDLSRLFFGGKLPFLRVVVEKLAPRALSALDVEREGGPVIVIAAHVAVVWSWAFARLLHECVRAWVELVEGTREESYRGHGPRFCDKANEIGERLAIPRVSPKARGGAGSPVEWPMSKPSDSEVKRFATAVPMPLERVELSALRDRVKELTEALQVAEALAAARLDELHGVCREVGSAVRREVKERDRVIAETSGGGTAAKARAVAAALEALRDRLSLAVSDEAARELLKGRKVKR